MIDTIINYCSVDNKFIKKNIEQCLKFSNKVIVPICDHLLNGTPEDIDVIKKSLYPYLNHESVDIVQYEWNSQESARWHHNMSRWIGLNRSESEYVLFLDADEIIEGDTFKRYIDTDEYKKFDVISLACYWYFREPVYRSTTLEMAGSLYKKEICTPSIIFTNFERWSYRYFSNLNVLENLKFNNNIMCNHFSWVRTKEEMLTKVNSWGHSGDRDWKSLVEEEFSRPFNGTDFVHGYSYNIVNNKFNIEL